MARKRTSRAGALAAALGIAFAAAAAGAQEGPAVRAVYRAEGAPAAPGAEAWSAAPESALPLSAQIIIPPVGGGETAHVSVRAIHDGEWLALRLEWSDATADRRVGAKDFRDAVAVGFPQEEGDSPPSPFMGDPAHPVAIWQWAADLEASAAGEGAFAEGYPHTDGVWIFPQDERVRERVRGWRSGEPVQEFVATGYGTLAPREGTEVRGASARGADTWRVVLRRRLAPESQALPVFRPGERTHLIAAVWDGAAGEVNGRKSVTLSWAPFALEAVEARHGGE